MVIALCWACGGSSVPEAEADVEASEERPGPADAQAAEAVAAEHLNDKYGAPGPWLFTTRQLPGGDWSVVCRPDPPVHFGGAWNKLEISPEGEVLREVPGR